MELRTAVSCQLAVTAREEEQLSAICYQLQQEARTAVSFQLAVTAREEEQLSAICYSKRRRTAVSYLLQQEKKNSCQLSVTAREEDKGY